MAFSLTSLLSFIPQFAVGGLLAIYFFSFFRRLSPFAPVTFELGQYKSNSAEKTPYEAPKYTRTRGDLDDLISRSFTVNRNVYFIAKKSMANIGKITSSNFLAEIQILILALNLWIILSLVLSPFSMVSSLLPTIPMVPSQYIYMAMSILLSAAVLTTAASRLMPRGKMLALFVGLSGGSTFLLLYYAPLMAWVHSFIGIYMLLILYSSVVVVCFSAYFVATVARRHSAFLASSYTSFASYALTAFLLFFNMVALMLK